MPSNSLQPGPSSTTLSQAPNFAAWLTKRRIAISLIALTSLILLNICVLKTQPQNLFDWTSAGAVGGCALVLLGLAIRTWAAGTLRKSEALIQDGPYAMVRNPLYLGSFLMMFGFCVLTRDLLSLLFISGPLVAIYWVQVRQEEKNLAKWFPDQWPTYSHSVPRFFPRRLQRPDCSDWALRQWLKNREYKAVLASCVGIVAIAFWSWSWYGQ